MIYSGSSINEECGVFGVFGSEEAATLTYYGLHTLQHRGQEGSGIIAGTGSKFTVVKNKGLVINIFNQESMDKLKGNMAIGHVRYSTQGENTYENVQPFLFHTMEENIGIAHNGNIVNAISLRKRLEDMGSIFQSTSDTEILVHVLKRKAGSFMERLRESLLDMDGAFSYLLVRDGKLYGARDRYGLRPLSLGRIGKEGTYVLSSETCAFKAIGAKFIRDIEPGEIVCISEDGVQSEFYTKDTSHHMCMMEYVYFARPDSHIDGVPVYGSRVEAGKALYKESPADADVVIGVPDSSIPAAIGYSKEAKISYGMGLVKNRYVGRTFIQPTQKMREKGVRMKLSPLKEVIDGKRIVLVDDSIVRGTTCKQIVKLLKKAGAEEVHVRIASPPLVMPCFYGVDTSSFKELISSRLSVEELKDYIGADSLAFLSCEGLLQTTEENKGSCMACFNGEFPTPLYGALEKAKKEADDE